MKQLALDESEWSDIVATMRVDNQELRKQRDSYKEINRILLRENLDLKDYLEEKGHGNKMLANYIHLFAKEVIGSKNPLFRHLQAKIQVAKSDAWDNAFKLVSEYMKDNKLNISFQYSFTSSNDPSSSNYYGSDAFEYSDPDIFQKISDLIFNPNSVDKEVTIAMPEVFSPYQKLQTETDPTVLIDKKVGAVLVLNRQVRNDISYFNWNIYSPNKGEANLGIEFITFSDFYSSLTF